MLKKDNDFRQTGWFKQRGEVVTSRYRGSKIYGSQQAGVLTIIINFRKKEKTLAHSFQQSIDNANGLCQERSLRLTNVAIVTT